MLNEIGKGIKEVKFLYIGIALLLIIAVFLILILLPPKPPIEENIVPSQPTPSSFNSEQLRELLSAPVVDSPAEISKDVLNSLEGKNEPVVPSQDVMNMLSAPPTTK